MAEGTLGTAFVQVRASATKLRRDLNGIKKKLTRGLKLSRREQSKIFDLGAGAKSGTKSFSRILRKEMLRATKSAGMVAAKRFASTFTKQLNVSLDAGLNASSRKVKSKLEKIASGTNVKVGVDTSGLGGASSKTDALSSGLSSIRSAAKSASGSIRSFTSALADGLRAVPVIGPAIVGAIKLGVGAFKGLSAVVKLTAGVVKTALGAAFRAVGGLVKGVVGIATGAFKALTSVIGKVASKIMGTVTSMKAMAVATAAFAAAAAALRHFTNAAADAEEAQNKFAEVFKSSSKSVATELETFSAMAKRSSMDLKEMASGFGALLLPMGASEKEAGNMSVALSKLVSDLASFHNVAEETARRAVFAGLVGEAEPVRRLGVQLSEARVQNEIYNAGWARSRSEITSFMKVQARMNILFRDTMVLQGDAVRTAGSYTNSVRGLRGATKDAAIAIGQIFLPAGTAVMNMMADTVMKIRDNEERFIGWGKSVGRVADKVISVFKGFKSVVGSAITAVREGLTAGLGIDPVVALGKAFEVVLNMLNGAGDNIRAFGGKMAESVRGVAVIAGQVVKLVARMFGIKDLNKWLTQMAKVGNVKKHFQDLIKPLEKVGKAMGQAEGFLRSLLGQGAEENPLEPMSETAIMISKSLRELALLAQDAFNNIKVLATGLLDSLVSGMGKNNPFQGLLDKAPTLLGFIQSVRDGLNEAFSRAAPVALKLANIIGKIVGKIWAGIANIKFGEIVGELRIAFTGAKVAVENLVATVGNLLGSLGEATGKSASFGEMVGAAMSFAAKSVANISIAIAAITEDWSKTWEAIVATFGVVVERIVDAFKGAWDAVSRYAGDVIMTGLVSAFKIAFEVGTMMFSHMIDKMTTKLGLVTNVMKAIATMSPIDAAEAALELKKGLGEGGAAEDMKFAQIIANRVKQLADETAEKIRSIAPPEMTTTRTDSIWDGVRDTLMNGFEETKNKINNRIAEADAESEAYQRKIRDMEKGAPQAPKPKVEGIDMRGLEGLWDFGKKFIEGAARLHRGEVAKKALEGNQAETRDKNRPQASLTSITGVNEQLTQALLSDPNEQERMNLARRLDGHMVKLVDKVGKEQPKQQAQFA